ncbi:hypothetical protein HPG69_012010 [Diceros bicornis minor]|uniref:Uncharacterized protein n=1 Tax=Diceros bicornis minor TaxID=77932 RepID=A0A7J7EHV4_DICBM|nr:hypothetical protein HPG69_012010 [Diceros bicornis minor]
MRFRLPVRRSLRGVSWGCPRNQAKSRALKMTKTCREEVLGMGKNVPKPTGASYPTGELGNQETGDPEGPSLSSGKVRKGAGCWRGREKPAKTGRRRLQHGRKRGREDLLNSEWAEEKDSRAHIPVFLSVEAMSITSRPHGKNRKIKIYFTQGTRSPTKRTVQAMSEIKISRHLFPFQENSPFGLLIKLIDSDCIILQQKRHNSFRANVKNISAYRKGKKGIQKFL